MAYLRLFFFLAPIFLTLSATALAQEEHSHGGKPHSHAVPGAAEGGTGPVTLTEDAIRNLGIETAPATLAATAKAVAMPARIELLPERRQLVTPRFQGVVEDIRVAAGQQVSKGQALVTIQPANAASQPITLHALVDGVVLRQDVALGQGVGPDTAMMEIGDTRRLLVRGVTYDIPGLGALAPGRKASAAVDLLPGKTFEGEAQRVDAALDAHSHTFGVYVVIDNPEGQLLPYLHATLNVQTGGSDEVLTVPAKAVLGGMGRYFLFVREGEMFERREVTLGARYGERIEIIEGVLPDEEVVVTGNYQLQYVQPAKQEEKKTDEHGHDHGDHGHEH